MIVFGTFLERGPWLRFMNPAIDVARKWPDMILILNVASSAGFMLSSSTLFPLSFLLYLILLIVVLSPH